MGNQKWRDGIRNMRFCLIVKQLRLTLKETQKRKAVAKMLAKGYPVEEIVVLTGLGKAVVGKLKKVGY